MDITAREIVDKQKKKKDCDIPLVSIGIPTFNRPDGLKRTLTNICGQTYENLEIVVSDNFSDNRESIEVAKQFTTKDSRVRFFRQGSRLTIFDNFKFVLANSNGKYFMWAADDDEWDPRFISVCVLELRQGALSAISNIDTLFRKTGKRKKIKMPRFKRGSSRFHDVQKFLLQMTPSMIYGLHHRDRIQFFLDAQPFDFYDCYFVIRNLIRGRMAINNDTLYTAGIDDNEYRVKPFKNRNVLNLEYWPFYSSVVKEVIGSNASILEKIKVIFILTCVISKLFIGFELLYRRKR